MQASIELYEGIKGHVTPIDLINAVGTFQFRQHFNVPMHLIGGKMFNVAADNYLFEFGCKNSVFYLSCNQDIVNIPLIDVYRPNGFAICYVEWQPTS